jgi:hypothetical protein
MLAFLKKTFLENVREWKILILALTFAPCFVYMMYGYFEATAPAYRLLVINLDDGAASGAGSGVDHARALLQAWRAAAHPDGRAAYQPRRSRVRPRPQPRFRSRGCLVRADRHVRVDRHLLRGGRGALHRPSLPCTLTRRPLELSTPVRL